jgi:hypothetical protein
MIWEYIKYSHTKENENASEESSEFVKKGMVPFGYAGGDRVDHRIVSASLTLPNVYRFTAFVEQYLLK